jgi:hypothetical protein
MKNIFILGAALVAIGGTTSVTRDAYAASCNSTTCTGTVSVLHAYGDNSASRIRLDTDTAPSGCTLFDGKYWLLANTVDAKRAFDLLLSAKLSGNSVLLRMVDGQSTCTVHYAQLI